MNKIIEFFSVYWKEILYASSTFISLMCVIFRKCKVKVIDSAYEVVVQKIPFLINRAEFLFSKGIDKKNFVLNACVNLLADITHKSFETCSVYHDRFSQVIEDILSTPTKKGVKCETINEKIQRS